MQREEHQQQIHTYKEDPPPPPPHPPPPPPQKKKKHPTQSRPHRRVPAALLVAALAPQAPSATPEGVPDLLAPAGRGRCHGGRGRGGARGARRVGLVASRVDDVISNVPDVGGALGLPPFQLLGACTGETRG